jgi:hypothetical protein
MGETPYELTKNRKGDYFDFEKPRYSGSIPPATVVIAYNTEIHLLNQQNTQGNARMIADRNGSIDNGDVCNESEKKGDPLRATPLPD